MAMNRRLQMADEACSCSVLCDTLSGTLTFMRAAVLFIAAIAVLHSAFAQVSSGAGVFQRHDKNGDGKVTKDELPNAPIFARFDVNKDGAITLQEYQQVIGGKPAPSGAADVPAKPVLAGPSVTKAGEVGIGRQVPDVAFTTLDGKAHRLSEWRAHKGVVIAMTSTTCPVSKRYAPSLVRLEKDLAQQNIALLLVNPFASEKAEGIAAFIKQHSITASYVHDSSGALAAALSARSTTEVLLIDDRRTLIYRGALDDQYGLNYNLDAPRVSYLRDAVAALLAGHRPEIAATEAPGCELDLPAKKTAVTTAVTYHRDVARILQQNCVQCHHAGGIAPFSLEDITEVKDRAKTIRRVIEQRQMPPWFAAPIAEGAQNPWANDCSLSTRDKADLLAWLSSADRPVGNPADAPAPLKFTDEWSIGKPDLILQLPKPFDIKAEGFMPYQFAVTETKLTEDKWVAAYEIMPSVREVVHHVIVQVHEKGSTARARDEGTGGFWAVYVPGNARQIYPAGFARKLPAGSTVSFQIHYTPNGKAVKEQMRMGLVFAKTPPQQEVKTFAVSNNRIAIPPGASAHVETQSRHVTFDIPITSFMAHMHVRGKAFKYEVTSADGKTETLLDIPRYDFNWQLRYNLKQPRLIPRGSTLKVTAIYDNSSENKANPNPAKLVKWGNQTYEEMMMGFFEYFTPVSSAEAAMLLSAESEEALRARVVALFGALRAGDIAQCIELSDPATVKKHGKDKAEQFFKSISDRTRLAKLAAGDHAIKSITAGNDGKTARVEIQVRLAGQWRPPSTDVWALVGSTWCYQETLPK
ncbi:MAG: redoxin domain-containing protein [Pedosphaera sp.]|nr:redoxin domain-containing protein [Pedosphaera sp.]